VNAHNKLSEADQVWLQRCADFYGIDMDEALRRRAVVTAQTDDPNDPICIGCARRPHEINAYIEVVQGAPDAPVPTAAEVRQYVIEEEGTYNRENGHFLCDEDYIKNGMPSRDGGWVCP